jgi:alanine dehydrogenase
MSWNFSATVTRADLEEQLRETAKVYFEQFSEVMPSTDDQVATAIQAAELIAQAVGTDGELMINLSGHSNPDHGKAEGYGNEVISVSVSEK